MFVALGLWQLDRAEQKRAEAQTEEARAASPSLRIDSLVADSQGLRHRQVQVEGRFEPDRQFFIEGRREGGRNGLHVITPLRLSGSEVRVLVNRRWSARRGRVDMGSLFPNAAGTRLDLNIDPTEGAMRAPVGFRIGLSDPQGAPEWGTARVDFGDGSPEVRIPVTGEARTTHRYAAAGEYRLVVDVRLTSGLRLQEAARVRIGQAVTSAAHSEAGAPLAGFDANLVKAPVTMRVERVMVRGSTLSLRGRFVREPRDTPFWLWISTGVGRPRLYDVSSAPDSGDPATFAQSVTPHPPVTGDIVVGIVVGVRKDTGRGVAGRTDPIWFPWPAVILTLGSGVVVGPLDRQP